MSPVDYKPYLLIYDTAVHSYQSSSSYNYDLSSGAPAPDIMPGMNYTQWYGLYGYYAIANIQIEYEYSTFRDVIGCNVYNLPRFVSICFGGSRIRFR